MYSLLGSEKRERTNYSFDSHGTSPTKVVIHQYGDLPIFNLFLFHVKRIVLHIPLRDNSVCVGSWVYIGPRECKKTVSVALQIRGPGRERHTLLECCLSSQLTEIMGALSDVFR